MLSLLPNKAWLPLVSVESKICVWTLQRLADLLATDIPTAEKMAALTEQADALVAIQADDTKGEHRPKMTLDRNQRRV